MCKHKKWTQNCLDCNYRFKTIKPWSYTRELVFPRRSPKNKFYFGIELEVECACSREDVMDTIKEYITDVWEFKYDSSLANGVEFESQPKSLSQWLNEGLLDWVKHLPAGCKSHDTTTCGLHIHVNRDGFNTFQDIQKVNYFLNIHQDKFEKLGRRQWNQYCGSNPGFVHSSSLKFHALNLSRHDTIEFRFPKGTLYTPTIRATIALISAICEIVPKFTKQELEEKSEWCWQQFLQAIATGNCITSKHMYKYMTLHAYLNKHGFWSKELTKMFKES